MRKTIKRTIRTIGVRFETSHYLVLGTGAAVFFFGFAGPAALNYYLLAVHSPLVLQYRSTLNYASSIFGDGIILPIVAMIIVSFLLTNSKKIYSKNVAIAVFFGVIITVYFHVNQALNGLTNWTMPQPWHWNALGVWHALYMFSVSSILSLFYVIAFVVAKKRKILPKEVVIVTFGIVVFLLILRLDYLSVDLKNLVRP